jgi:hypothetical protein
MMELGHRETKPSRKRLGLNVEENKSKTKGVRLSGDIAQHFYHLVKERIMDRTGDVKSCAKEVITTRLFWWNEAADVGPPLSFASIRHEDGKRSPH